MDRIKRAIPKPFKCEKYGHLFGNERALGQHINSKAHAPVINPNKNILSIAYSPPTALSTPFKLLVPGPIDFDGTPENEIDIPRKDYSTFYILTTLPGKGHRLITVQNIPKDTRIISEKPLFQIPKSRIEIEQPALKKIINKKLNFLL